MRAVVMFLEGFLANTLTRCYCMTTIHLLLQYSISPWVMMASAFGNKQQSPSHLGDYFFKLAFLLGQNMCSHFDDSKPSLGVICTAFIVTNNDRNNFTKKKTLFLLLCTGYFLSCCWTNLNSLKIFFGQNCGCGSRCRGFPQGIRNVLPRMHYFF